MFPEDIDDLFRDKLDGHPTPPGDALWARLQAASSAEPKAENPTDISAERLDQLFQKGLSTHATPPGRELWERLEDEHLRPRKHRPAAWWPMALAAAVALLLVAGGAGLWLGYPSGNTQSGTMASHTGKGNKSAAGHEPNGPAAGLTKGPAAAQGTEATTASGAAANPADMATNNAARALKTASSAINQKNKSTQATRLTDLASTASKARMAASGQSPRHPLGTRQTPDAAAGSSPLVARTTPRSIARPGLNHTTPTVADERRPTTKPEPLVATTIKPVPAPEIVPAHAVPTPSVASAAELITVDVRNGGNAARPARPISTALAAADEPEEHRGLGGRLLRQAGHLVRGERVSLAEATGLPENVTLRATIAGRSVSKSIQL